MAKILCVLYPDPVDGYPDAYARDRPARPRPLSERADPPQPHSGRVHARPAARQRLRRARPAGVPRAAGSHAGRDLGQGRSRLGLRARACGRRRRDLAAVLARLPDRRAHRQGAQPQARDHGRHRLRPRRPRRGHGARRHRRRGHVLQQHQRGRARRDDDPRAGAQLHPVLRVGDQGRLEHRRLRGALLRPGGHDRRDVRRRPHRPRRAAAPQALRRGPALHRQVPADRRRRAGARPDVPRGREVAGPGLRRASPSTRRCTPRPKGCSTASCSRR